MRVSTVIALLQVFLGAAISSASTGALPGGGPTKIIQTDLVCPTESATARLAYNDALQLQQQGRLDEAEEAFRAAIKEDPAYCDAMDNLGVMLRNEGKTDQAITWYERSISEKPDNAVAHQNLAVAYMVQKDSVKATAEYRWLTRNDPENPEGYYGLGNLFVNTGKAEEAIAPLQRAVELYRAQSSPLLADAQYELGVAYYRTKQFPKALDTLRQLAAARADDPYVNYLIGLCYLEPSMSNRNKAREYLLKARTLGLDVPQHQLDELDRPE